MLEAEGEAYGVIARIMTATAVGHMGIHIAQADGHVICAAVANAPEKIIGAAAGRVSFAKNPQGAGGIQVSIELARDAFFPTQEERWAYAESITVLVNPRLVIIHKVARGTGNGNTPIDGKGVDALPFFVKVYIVIVDMAVFEKAVLQVFKLHLHFLLVWGEFLSVSDLEAVSGAFSSAVAAGT